jgi:hypothetical protein
MILALSTIVMVFAAGLEVLSKPGQGTSCTS